jgi:hypothetical protein
VEARYAFGIAAPQFAWAARIGAVRCGANDLGPADSPPRCQLKGKLGGSEQAHAAHPESTVNRMLAVVVSFYEFHDTEGRPPPGAYAAWAARLHWHSKARASIAAIEPCLRPLQGNRQSRSSRPSCGSTTACASGAACAVIALCLALWTCRISVGAPLRRALFGDGSVCLGERGGIQVATE